MGELLVTALGKALEMAGKSLAEARAVPKRNVVSCIRFLQAAQHALRGLEDEVDAILVEAKIVARFQWEARVGLLRRINAYLNRYRLAPVLDEAIKGIKECHDFAGKDAESFWSFLQTRRAEKVKAMKEVDSLLGRLTDYLNHLGNSMGYTRENYAGPSGIDMPFLLDLEKDLATAGGAEGDKIKKKIIRTADMHLGRRQRKGLQHATAAGGLIQKLMNAFGVSLPGGTGASRGDG
jgi:hypothetical protein